MSGVISLNSVSKAYQLGVFNTGSFSNDLSRWWALKRGKEDPFLKIGEENDRTSVGKTNIIWSLKDLSFDIEQGDRVGIIGRNGAGKSTLLKILSQVTHPTSGQIKLKGRVASLLEVGTGFHPELTGRENVFLNGAILGMRKDEIKEKFDEIVDFSGVERYIDTPVKRYSSGMYVRLAFAVAAHLESDILIVDEVLAVGDAEFQKKCIGKMNQLGSSGGRTILFVSHNMSSIKQLCDKAIFLEKGAMNCIGETKDIIGTYLRAYAPKKASDGDLQGAISLHGTGDVKFTRFLTLKQDQACEQFFFGERPTICIEIEAFKDIPNACIDIHVVSLFGETIMMITPDFNYKPRMIEKGKHQIHVMVEELLMPGEYSFHLSVASHPTGLSLDFIEAAGNVKILRDSLDLELNYPWQKITGHVKPRSKWNFDKL
jgi:lipopolysaccharide transport system ATP-binding protein